MSELAKWETYRYFSKDEFLCSCCGEALMVHEFVRKLDAIRLAYGKPLRVNSGYRCPTHNNNISSTGLTGPHTTGRAVDFGVARADVHRLLGAIHRTAATVGDVDNTYFMTGFGFNQKGPTESRFIHLDDLIDGPRPNVWTY